MRMPRLTSRFFVSALVRQVFTAGGFAATTRKGAEEAGVVFVLVDRMDGTVDLYGPAPQAFMDTAADDRAFELLIAQGTREEAQARLESEKRMDPDFWVVEIEKKGGTDMLQVVDTSA